LSKGRAGTSDSAYAVPVFLGIDQEEDGG
jgi:hypothetical protein